MCGSSDKEESDAVTSSVVQDRERDVSGGICNKMSGTVKRVMAHGPTICMCGGSDKKVSDAVTSGVVREQARNVTDCEGEWHGDVIHVQCHAIGTPYGSNKRVSCMEKRK
jgi:hypothetical protein